MHWRFFILHSPFRSSVRCPAALNPLAHHIMQRALDLGSHSDADRDPAELQSTPKGKDRKPKGFFKWKGKSSTEPHGLEDDDFGHTHASPAKADVPSRPPDRPKPSQSHSRTPSQLDEEPGEDFVKVFTSKKPAPAFNHLRQTQDLSGLHVGAIWTVKFSFCGRLMATAGQDTVVRVWSVKDTGPFLEEMKRKFGRTDAPETASSSSSSSASRPASTHGSTSTMLHATFPDGSGATARATTAGPSPVHSRPTSVASTTSHASDVSAGGFHSHARTEGPGHSRDGSFGTAPTGMSPEDWQLFEPQPVCQYKGHSADVLDVSWSKNYFLLSSSMDKTVRLWHIVRQECLCVFQHADFVTAIAFHPRDDRYFLSGSMDSTLRLWNIPEKKVALWNEIVGPSSSFITAANFCQNGKMAVVGTYDGRCLFYDSERLKYHTQILVRSSRGKNSKGRKITAIEPMPGEDKILITSNDSRIRLYDLKDLTLTCKYKGSTNSSSQIKASFSNDGKYIICGSEYQNVYVWNTFLDDALVRKGKLSEKFTGFRRDRNESFEFFAGESYC
ncbi:WD repeat domain-containing protein, variant [Capsaspora owczarzaki ATCC 30864]|uniref:WD repeat domain-containing protein, variant n=1 Tax=Capsaspora owczarzaki (strain ATCC 30864) TaxID=595528 RepID=A0A0D2X268_CAPO3|nr:WD repeat domain-containing protein, variant [Capsaspora owczarzaki ATCC 30864]